MACNTVFFGSHEVAIPMLEYLLTRPEVVLSAIVSQPDRSSGRGKILKPTMISSWAMEHNIPLMRPEHPDAQFVRSLNQCDLILVMAYGHILREEVLSLPRLGIYNFHASILPKYRGASPIETALACGETYTGVSLMEIVSKMDAGDVIDTESIQVDPMDYAHDLYRKLSQSCVLLLERQLNNLVTGKITKQPQNVQYATYTRKIIKHDGFIDYRLSVNEVFNRIRGFHDHVGTSTKLNGTVLNIGYCKPIDRETIFEQIGQIISIDDQQVIVTTRCGTLAIFELQRPGGKKLIIRDFINGFPLKIGDIFESERSMEIVSDRPFPWKK